MGKDWQALNKRKKVEKNLKTISLLILFTAIIGLGFGAYVSFSCSANMLCKIALIFFILISLIGAIELLCNKFNILIKPVIVKVGAYVYKKKYNEALDEYKSILPE